MSWYNRFCSSALGSTHVKFDAWPGPQFYSSFRSLESTNEETIMFFLKRSNHSMTLSPSQTVHLTTTPTHHHRHSQPTYDVSPVSLKANIKKPNWTGDGRQYHLLVPQQLILPTVLSGLLLMSTPIGRKVIPWKTKQYRHQYKSSLSKRHVLQFDFCGCGGNPIGSDHSNHTSTTVLGQILFIQYVVPITESVEEMFRCQPLLQYLYIILLI